MEVLDDLTFPKARFSTPERSSWFIGTEITRADILDIKATDQSGAIYDIEMQLFIFKGLVQRIVYYSVSNANDRSDR